MNVAAESDMGCSGGKAARSFHGASHVGPAARIARFRVHVESVTFMMFEGQAGEEASLACPEFAARPFDCDLGKLVHMLARGADGTVVIAQHGDSTLVDQFYDGSHHPFRVGTIADVVAEQDDAFRAVRARLSQASFKSLPVGVNIGEKGDQHALTPVTEP